MLSRYSYFLYILRSQLPAMAVKSRSLCRRAALFSIAIWATKRSTVFLTVAPFFSAFPIQNSAAAIYTTAGPVQKLNDRTRVNEYQFAVSCSQQGYPSIGRDAALK